MIRFMAVMSGARVPFIVVTLYALASAGLLAGCEDDRRGFAAGNEPTIVASTSADVGSVGDHECDAFLERLRICNPSGAQTQGRMRQNMVAALASSSTRAEAIAVCVKSFEMLRVSCPQPGDPPIQRSSSAAPSASAGPQPGDTIFVPMPAMSGLPASR